MPRIRKKTSNRQTTRDKAKINKKVSEYRRKTNKAAKKNPQWKSKKKADPGVPNNFPYKDRVLAELADEKRRAEEAKQARRDAARAPLDEPEEETPGIATLASSSVLSGSAPIGGPSSSVVVEEDDAPELIDNSLARLQDVLDEADVILQVVDARDIQGGRSGYIEKLVTDAGGKYGLIVNKSDLVPRETLQAWLPHLPLETFLFSSRPESAFGKTELFARLSFWAKDGAVKIALMGLPNVGKTSVLNSLLPPSAPRHTTAPLVPTSTQARNPTPTTVKPSEVVIDVEGVKAHIIDTPGWEPAEEDEDEEDLADKDEAFWDGMQDRLAADMLRRNLGRIDRVKDIFPIASYILERSNSQDLMVAYNVPFFQPGDIEAFLLAVARSNGRVKKHGDVDVEAAARIVVRDWATGQFPHYVPAPSASTSAAVVPGERPDMSAALAACKTRKELRSTGRGLIKFKGGEIDNREIVLDDDYVEMLHGSEDEDDDDEDEDEEDEAEDDEEDEEEGEELILAGEDGEELDLKDGAEPSSGSDVPEDQEEEEEPEPVPRNKRKRKSDVVAVPPKKAKRVSFGKNEVRVMSALKGTKRKR